jgi:signal transduction histidine kinase
MQKKIIVTIILFVIFISTTLGVTSYLTVQESINRSLRNRLMLAGLISDYIEFSLQNNLNRLYDISLSGKVDLRDNDWEPESKALETAYKYSLFTDGVFLLDKSGNQLLTYPPRDEYFQNLSYIHYVNQVLLDKKPVISGVYTLEPIKKQVIFMMVPLRDKGGDIVGVAGGVLNPTYPFINQVLHSVSVGKKSYIEVIDANEIVIASYDPSSVLTHHDHEGALGRMIVERYPGIRESGQGFSNARPGEKGKDILAVVPLKIAPWAVIVGESENEIFAPARELQKKFLILVIIFIATSIVFAMGMSKSIVKPIKSLISATNRVALGELANPVGDLGSDEILLLSRSFDDMRKKLAESLENIQRYNAELEHRVAVRTEQIRRSQKKVENLLKMVISSQEEERRRIARGLHDEILQDLSAFLIRLDICRLYPEQRSTEKIDEMKAIMLKTLDDIHNVIQGMRPLILDDLGLDAAVVWLLDKHLGAKGIDYHLGTDNFTGKRFAARIEITLFRIIQEAIVNIARHSEAKNVLLTITANDRSVGVCIEDDGRGFDVQETLKNISDVGRGLGIMGMTERASLLDGKFAIHSTPGEGTRMSVRIPLIKETEDV